MSVASTWLDIVAGIDFHIEMVPTPVPTPVPFPHPHCSVIWDPVGSVMGEITGMAFAALVGAPIAPGGPVLVGGQMGTVVGDAASMPIKHIIIPPGTAFVVGIPSSDAELMVGSQTVTFRGASAVRGGEVALPCSEPLPLPTGAVVPIPKGPYTTLVGGPPGMAWGSAAQKLGARALRTTWAPGPLPDLVQAIIPETLARQRRLAHKSACFFTGHPVNVATGGVTTSAVDFTLPGPIPLTFERDYDTNWFDRRGPLGYGWSHSLDGRVWIEAGRVVVLTADGRELEFSTRDLHEGVARDGDAVWHPVERATLRAMGHHRWALRHASGHVHIYGPVAGEPHDDARRGCSRLLSIEDRAGHAVAFAYDDRARLAKVTDSGGREIVFEHDAGDRLRRVWLPSADGNGVRQHVEYRYDDTGDLVEINDALGNATRFEYSRHLLVRETDRNDRSFYFTYDGYGRYARCIRTWGDGGIYDHVLAYDRPGRKTIVTNALGETSVYTCDSLGMVTTIVRPNGTTLAFEYDITTRLTARTDELGRTTRHAYDQRGNRIRTVAPDQTTTQTEYDAHDQPIARTDADGGQWAWQYDRQGNLVQRVDPIGRATRFVHEDGNLVAIVDPAGHTTTMRWSATRTLVESTAPDGTTARWRHDALGRVVQTDVAGNVRRQQYDALGRLVRDEAPDGNVRELVWDGEGNLVRTRDRLGDSTLTYFGMGQLASRTVGGQTVRYDYDNEGQLIAVVDAAGRVHQWRRDPGGHVVAEIACDGQTTIYERDAAGRVTRVRRPGLGRWSTVAYDAMDRPVRLDHADGGWERYTYDPLGRLVQADNPHASVVLTRDAVGRVVQESTTLGAQTHTVESKLDHAGRRVGLRSSLGAEVTIARNAVGAVTRMHHHGEGFADWEVGISRNGLGQEVDRQLPGDARSYWWRDAQGRPTQHWVGRADASVRTRKYTWAAGGRITAITDQGVAALEYEYDAHGALVKATHADGEVEHRKYDAAGNLFASLTGADRAYGLAGELLERRAPDGVTTYAYDAQGNLAQRRGPGDASWHYHWDDTGTLAQVDLPDGSAVAMQYDALARRIVKRHAGACTRWVWDGDVKLHQWQEPADAPEPKLTPAEQTQVRFLETSREQYATMLGDDWRPRWDALLANDDKFPRAHAVVRVRLSPGDPATVDPPTVDPTVITWLHEPETFTPLARLTKQDAHALVGDHLGTPLAVLAADASLAARLVIDTDGHAEIEGDATLCPFRFAGQYFDPETGLYENRFRYYDPACGRYVSRDPIGLRGGIAAYAYVQDPVGSVDPLGLAAAPVAGSGCAAPQTDANAPRVALPSVGAASSIAVVAKP